MKSFSIFKIDNLSINYYNIVNTEKPNPSWGGDGKQRVLEDKTAGLPKDIILRALGFFIGQQYKAKENIRLKRLYNQIFIIKNGTVLVGKIGGITEAFAMNAIKYWK